MKTAVQKIAVDIATALLLFHYYHVGGINKIAATG